MRTCHLFNFQYQIYWSIFLFFLPLDQLIFFSPHKAGNPKGTGSSYRLRIKFSPRNSANFHGEMRRNFSPWKYSSVYFFMQFRAEISRFHVSLFLRLTCKMGNFFHLHCMFSFWYVPMHLCEVVLLCGSLVTENVWNKVFTIKSTRTESYYNTWTLKYLYSICLISRRRTSRRICHMP